MKWTIDPFRYKRRLTRVVRVGSVAVGGRNPIRLQSMTTTSTLDMKATVDQVLRLADVGCEIARITAPTVNEARNLENIKNALIKKGCLIPLVADIHFRPDAAMVAADFVEKVRINPGNFTDGKAFKVHEYTDAEYRQELNKIEEKFTPLVLKLKKLNRALRIGTNHGSLSDRIMNRFGDTPLGMVESALEFARICLKNDFHDIIFSMKASNPRIMIAAYRLLAQRLEQEGMDYPFHLGVTEAGDGEDGRIKSAAGIGSLLEDGIGDTIRVSLTEDPEHEIPVAQELAEWYSASKELDINHNHSYKNPKTGYTNDPFLPSRRETDLFKSGPLEIGSSSPLRVASRLNLSNDSSKIVLQLLEERLKKDTPPEIIEIPFTGEGFKAAYDQFRSELKNETSRLAFWISFHSGLVPPTLDMSAEGFVYQCGAVWDENELGRLIDTCRKQGATLILKSETVDGLLQLMSRVRSARVNLIVGLAGRESTQTVHTARSLVAELRERQWDNPILLSWSSPFPSLRTAVVFGSLICDGIGDLISVEDGPLSPKGLDFSYNLLQACGNRLTKTEFVSCPSCGRTLFDLQSTTERIKSKTGHLKGVKIAIMGCIVNGPGEMADADFGYVGGGPGKINLYVGKTCVEKSIPSDLADEKLISLIKSHGKWVDPPH